MGGMNAGKVAGGAGVRGPAMIGFSLRCWAHGRGHLWRFVSLYKHDPGTFLYVCFTPSKNENENRANVLRYSYKDVFLNALYIKN